MAAPITAFYAGVIGLLLLALSYQVVRNRRRAGVSLGSGGDTDLERAIRAQANLVEYAPMILFMMALVELAGTSAWLLHGCGGLLVVSRVLHATGLAGKRSVSPGRKFGIAGTWIVLLVISVAAIVTAT
jgi:uncharacterized membrane protein YecN with MAPEG domain